MTRTFRRRVILSKPNSRMASWRWTSCCAGMTFPGFRVSGAPVSCAVKRNFVELWIISAKYMAQQGSRGSRANGAAATISTGSTERFTQSWRTVSNGIQALERAAFRTHTGEWAQNAKFSEVEVQATAVLTRTRWASTTSSSFFVSREQVGAGAAAVPAWHRRRAGVRPGRRRLQGNRLRATSAPLQHPSSPDRAQVPAARRDRRPRHKPRARRQRVHRLRPDLAAGVAGAAQVRHPAFGRCTRPRRHISRGPDPSGRPGPSTTAA